MESLTYLTLNSKDGPGFRHGWMLVCILMSISFSLHFSSLLEVILRRPLFINPHGPCMLDVHREKAFAIVPAQIQGLILELCEILIGEGRVGFPKEGDVLQAKIWYTPISEIIKTASFKGQLLPQGLPNSRWCCHDSKLDGPDPLLKFSIMRSYCLQEFLLAQLDNPTS